MTPDTKIAIIEHAQKEFPREACGLVVIRDGEDYDEYFPCKNLAENQSDFIMDPADYAAAEDAGEILAVIHSHPNATAKPSQADLVACEASGLPWYILSLPNETWWYFEPSGYRAPLIGREFVHGVFDCWSLIRDWFREERNIELPDYERREEWWLKGDNLYMDNFIEAGFVPVDEKDIAVGDMILMQVQSKVVNHAAVYVGRGMMLHHLMKRLSSREIYGGYWRKHTRLIVRHKELA